MTIQIVANPNANAIELRGMNRGVFYNACLSGSVNLTDSERVDIINDIRTGAEGSTAYEAYAIHYTELRDSDGNSFANAIDAAAYVTSECNQIVGSGSKVVGPSTSIAFTLDATHTTVLISDGSAFPVNSIKAVAGDDGHVEIWEHGDEGVQLYDDIYLAFTNAAGALVPQTLAGAVNTLNALFTVSPVGAGGGFTPVYPTLDGVAITPVTAGGQDPIGDNIFGGTSTSQHGARYRSTEYIDAPGEYYTFRMANHGQFIFGLGSVANADVAEFDASSGNGHSGLFYSQAMYDYGSYMGPWTTYGSNSSMSYGPGWSFYGNDPMFRYSVAQQNMADGNDALFKVGITDGGYVGAWYFDIDETNDWILLSRSSTPLPEGDYFLGIKLASTSGQLVDVPLRWATDEAAPTMGWRYIESPDGSFHWPLFASTGEADWAAQNIETFYSDETNAAAPDSSGNYHESRTFVDAGGSDWYMPVSFKNDEVSSAPSNVPGVVYTEIPTAADSLFAPSVFSGSDLTLAENTAANIQVAPTGILNFTTAVSGLPDGLSFDGVSLVQGTAQYVSADTDYVISVTRSNAYGSSVGTFVLTITDNAAISSIAGWTQYQGNLYQPHWAAGSENSTIQWDTAIAQGQEITWSHANYAQLGILSTAGDAVKASADIAASDANWDLKFVTWTNHLNHLGGVGWDNNSSQSTGNNASIGWKLVYKTDGYMELYRDGVLMVTSSSTFAGDQTLTFATPAAYVTDTQIPSLVLTDTVFTGAPPAGFTDPLEHGSMVDATTLGSDSVAEMTITLSEGKRLVVPQAWVEANVLNGQIDALYEKAYIGVPKSTANWSSVDLHTDFDAVFSWEYTGASRHKSSASVRASADAGQTTINSATDAYYDFAIEWDGSDLHVIRCNINSITTEPGVSDGGVFSYTQTFSNYDGVRTGDLPLVLATKTGGTVTLSTAGIQEIDIPAAPAVGTAWTKALVFSGSNEHISQSNSSYLYSPLAMAGTGSTVSGPSSGFSTSANAHPWATAVVFKLDSTSYNQHIWNYGEGAGSTDDNIYLRAATGGGLYFGWGRQGAVNEHLIAYNLGAAAWYGCYIGHNGTRLSGSDATSSNLASSFSIKLMFNNNNNWIFNPNPGAFGAGQWSSTGGRMDREVGGAMTVGGRGGNRSFHGQVASMVVTTLRSSDYLPGNAEITAMITDPVGWMSDYKVGNPYRQPSMTGDASSNWALGNPDSSYGTQVWLMGDGSTDSYPNIDNRVASHRTNTQMNMQSMVSNDIQTVSIPGLS